MALVSQNIKNLVAGMSQQPDILRQPEQVSECLNGFPTESSGLQKRPPSQVVKDLGLYDQLHSKEPIIHYVSRDENERFFFVLDGKVVRAFTIGGSEIPVVDNSNGRLLTDAPREDLRLVTVADYTFIMNRKTTVEMTDSVTGGDDYKKGTLIYILQGQYGKAYRIRKNGSDVAVFVTPDGGQAAHIDQIRSGAIISHLSSALNNSGVSHEVDTNAGWIFIPFTEGNAYTTSDDFNDKSMMGITNSVQRFNLLPSKGAPNYYVKVNGDPSSDQESNYYVRFDVEKGLWRECAALDIEDELDPNTMPLQIVRRADGVFEISTADWEKRNSGDDDSNPIPSFVGLKLNDIFFHRDRLGVLAGENLILSGSGDYFNFWFETATDVLDTDPIDLPVTTNRINNLHYAIEWDEALYLFSDKAQFMLRTDAVLSPKTSGLSMVTEFSASPRCRPIPVGRNLYFTTERSAYTTVREFYTVQQVSEVKNSQDITSHVPSLIPNSVYEMQSCSNENIMMVLSKGDRKSIFVYKYLFINEQRLQSAWVKWSFQDDILGLFFEGSTMFIVINRGGMLALEKINFTYFTNDFPEEPYRVYLDSKRPLTAATYDNVFERTTVNINEQFGIPLVEFDYDIGIVQADGKYIEIPNEDIDKKTGEVVIAGNLLSQANFIGVVYPFYTKLSKFYIRRQLQDGSWRAMNNGRLQIRNLKINYSESGVFDVTVSHPSGNRFREYRMTTRDLGTPTATLGKIPVSTGTFRVPVQTLNENCDIYIKNNSPLPSAITGMDWEGNFVQKSREV